MNQAEKKEGPVIDAWKDRPMDRDNKLMTVTEWLEKHQDHTMWRLAWSIFWRIMLVGIIVGLFMTLLGKCHFEFGT